MSLYVVRHAKAGSRRDFDGDDRLRPLSRAGLEQAHGITLLLGHLPISKIYSSPYVRCVQTLQPLADRLGREIEIDQRLSEDEPFEPMLELLTEAPDGAVLSSHGDMIPATISALERRGMEIRTPPDWRKASVWVLRRNKHGKIVHAIVWPPPVQ